MVSVPLIAIFFPVKEAVVLQFPYCMGLFMYQAWHYRMYFSWPPMKPLLLGTVIGLFLGTFLLYQMPENFLKRMLALFIILIIIYNFVSTRQKIEIINIKSPWFGRICGFVSGSFLGAYNLGGPPAVMYFRAITNNPLEAKSFMASFFSILFLILVFVYGATGMFTLESLRTTILYLPPVVLGSAAGFWAFHRVSSAIYNIVVDVALLLISVILWANA